MKRYLAPVMAGLMLYAVGSGSVRAGEPYRPNSKPTQIAAAPGEKRETFRRLYPSASGSIDGKVDDGSESTGSNLPAPKELWYSLQNFYEKPSLEAAKQIVKKAAILRGTRRGEFRYTPSMDNSMIKLFKEARRLEKAGDLDQAIELYKECMAIDPRESDVYSRLGTIFYKKGDINKAIWMYEKANKMDPQITAFYRALGRLYELKGDKLKAFLFHSLFSVLNPKEAKRKRVLKKIESLRAELATD